MGELRCEAFDGVVIGAGPGGMAAAATAADSGARTALVDDNVHAGGQIWRRANGVKGSGSRLGVFWLNRVQRSAGGRGLLTRLQRTRVVAMPAPGELLAEHETGAALIGYKTLILATGAREMFLPFPGWTHPRVLGAGGLQALVKSGFSIAGKRVIVAGSGPLLLAVAHYLRQAGAIVPLIAEQARSPDVTRFAAGLVRTPSKVWQAVMLRRGLAGTRYCTDAWVTAVEEKNGALCAALKIAAGPRMETVDYLACGFGLVANVELAALVGCALSTSSRVAVDDWQQTSVHNVFAVGELTGIGGAEKAIVEGQIAGFSAVGRATEARKLFGWRWTALAFMRRLETAFALRPELKFLAGPDEIICRCEDITLGKLMGPPGGQSFHSWHDAKLHTRCGMGPCQGRICGPSLAFLTGIQGDLRIRPPILPTRIGTLAAEIGRGDPPV